MKDRSLNKGEKEILDNFNRALRKMKNEFDSSEDFYLALSYTKSNGEKIKANSLKTALSDIVAFKIIMPKRLFTKMLGFKNSYPYIIEPTKAFYDLSVRLKENSSLEMMKFLALERISPDFDDDLALDGFDKSQIAAFHSSTLNTLDEDDVWGKVLVALCLAFFYVEKNSSANYDFILDYRTEFFYLDDEDEIELYDEDDKLSEFRDEFNVIDFDRSRSDKYGEEVIKELEKDLLIIRLLKSLISAKLSKANADLLSEFNYREVIINQNFIDEFQRILREGRDIQSLFKMCLEMNFMVNWVYAPSATSNKSIVKIFHGDENPLLMYFY